jgi:hypothetical protein
LDHRQRRGHVLLIDGVALELPTSGTTSELASDHRWIAVVLVAVIADGVHGFVLGRRQWRILVARIPICSAATE